MYYHLRGGWRKLGREGRKTAKNALVDQGRSHGIIVYAGGTPVGWVQYGTREELPRTGMSNYYISSGFGKIRSPLWRIPCFFVDRDFRERGVATVALKAALAPIRKRGGGVVEAYPVADPASLPRKTHRGRGAYLWSGTVSMFENQGFKTVCTIGTQPFSGQEHILVSKRIR